MDGGFFLCPDAWEFLLPAEIRHLRDAGSVCQKRWDLLTRVDFWRHLKTVQRHRRLVRQYCFRLGRSAESGGIC